MRVFTFIHYIFFVVVCFGFALLALKSGRKSAMQNVRAWDSLLRMMGSSGEWELYGEFADNGYNEKLSLHP